MATSATFIPVRPSQHGSMRRHKSLRTEASGSQAGPSSSHQVAHTLTACTRCRQRKTRCDPSLPRCGPCERTNSLCEYWDSNKGHNVNRGYVVHLQHKARELEEELARLENEDSAEEPEAMMRAATVQIEATKEPKFLGPSSGIAITRLVMQLAKQFTDVKSIKDIVPDQQGRHIKELYNQEQSKPSSKIYPLISNVPADQLPNRDLANALVQLYKLKVQAMYPALHEPTMDKDIDAVFTLGDRATHYQHFVCRMVLAISLQKMDTQYAGLADSYYLAALEHLKDVVKPMDLKTLQCFALMAEYSLLTPTRTAIYYVVGIAVRLAQALGYNEERTITRASRADGRADFLEIDMRRRLFWCIMVMDLGLAHSLGRPAMLSTSQEHIDVEWFATCDDQYIRPEGIDPTAPRVTLKKWIAIHFFKMRMLQLEIRRKLYLKRQRDTPRSDVDPWFKHMDAKITAWRDAAPSADEGIGLDKKWFVGRYNTMIVFMYRPSPHVPRPSVLAAQKCFEACSYNIHIQREQIEKKNVDLTWIFTQSIFMAINTMLWSLSYEEVRRTHSRADVESYLTVAMDALVLAAARWPGVASAVQLYQNLIGAILHIYEKDGDVPISAATPSDVASPPAGFPDPTRSRGTSPATVASSSVATPPGGSAPFGQLSQQSSRSMDHSHSPFFPNQQQVVPQQPQPTPPAGPYPGHRIASSSGNIPTLHNFHQVPMRPASQHENFDPYSSFNVLPEFTFEAMTTVPGWTAAPLPQTNYTHAPHPQTQQTPQDQQNAYANPVFDPNSTAYPFPAYDPSQTQGPMLGASAGGGDMYGFINPSQPQPQQQQYNNWDMDSGNFGVGLNQAEQAELMRELEAEGMEDIQGIITTTLASITPKAPVEETTFQ